jgi:glycosyltransferase involved in cell wall biosynthesis
MKISIITPCSRILNLPCIYDKILKFDSADVEWIIIYDSENIDYRILGYETAVKIKLFNKKREPSDAYASMLRNIGIENAIGEYLYFLDDDNLPHPMLYEKVCKYGNGNNVLLFNQFSESKKYRLKDLDINNLRPGYIDTAQFVIPTKCKSRWDNEFYYIDEYSYFKKIVEEVGVNNVTIVNRAYSYRNYLRRYEI